MCGDILAHLSDKICKFVFFDPATSHLLEGWIFPSGVQYPSNLASFLCVLREVVGSLGGGVFGFSDTF